MATDRGRAALHKLVLLLIPELAGYVQWTYQVLAVYSGPTGGPPITLDLKAMAPSNPFGSTLAGVAMWPGSDGGVCIPTVGKLVIVRFNDTLTPAVCGIDPTDTPRLVYQFGQFVVIGDTSAAALTPASFSSGLEAALAEFGVAVAGVATGPLAPLNAPATALGSALGALPPPATTKTFGT